MNHKQYLLKLKGRLLFHLPAVSQREVLNRAEEFIRESKECRVDFTKNKPNIYTEYAGNINKEKNFRLLESVFFFITTIICGVIFSDMFQSGISSYTSLYVFADGVVLSLAFLLWIIFGVDCFWNSCYRFNKKIFYLEQMCFFIIAAAEQMIVGFVIPQMCIQGTFEWNLLLYYSVWGLFFALAVAEIFLLMRGRWQSYFSLIQIVGIMLSFAAFELRMNDIVDNLALLTEQPLILPYYSGLIACVILYIYLNQKILRNIQAE